MLIQRLRSQSISIVAVIDQRERCFGCADAGSA